MTAVVDQPLLTPDDFLKRPDRDRFELINGMLVEKNVGYRSSRLGVRVASLLVAWVMQHNLGWVAGADAGFQCFEQSLPDDPTRIRKPNVSFISLDRLPAEEVPEGYCDIVPDLVVEVVSPNDTYYELSEKIEEYLRAGVRLIWVVVPKTKTVRILRADGSTAELHVDHELSGEDVVVGFRCAVSEIFRTPTKS